MPGITMKLIEQSEKKTVKLKVPNQINIIKTGKLKQLAFYDSDWLYMRCALILGHLYHRSPAGVGTITKIYPSHLCCAADRDARKPLQALEHVRLVQKHPEGSRKLSSNGQHDLDRIAKEIVAKQSVASKQTGSPLLFSSKWKRSLVARETAAARSNRTLKSF